VALSQPHQAWWSMEGYPFLDQQNRLWPETLIICHLVNSANHAFSQSARMTTASHHVRLHWFRSFPMIPGDQPTRVLENQNISRPQPQSFS
jgi:hypothetical protein